MSINAEYIVETKTRSIEYSKTDPGPIVEYAEEDDDNEVDAEYIPVAQVVETSDDTSLGFQLGTVKWLLETERNMFRIERDSIEKNVIQLKRNLEIVKGELAETKKSAEEWKTLYFGLKSSAENTIEYWRNEVKNDTESSNCTFQ